MPTLPTGTVTFLFSDIEGSTALLKRLGNEAYGELMSTHRRLVRDIFGAFGGQEIDTQGDAFFYSFTRARDAVAAAVEVQRAHARARWPGDVTVRLRIGLHTGEPAVGDEGYTGLDVVRASRISGLGRGGQVLLSDTTRAIVAGDLPEGVQMRAMGERALRDIDRPEPVSELAIEGVDVTPAPSPEPRRTRATERPGWPFDEGGLPDWIGRSARRLGPGADQTADLIERRVMDAISRAFDAKAREHRPSGRGPDRAERRAARTSAGPPPPGRSVAKEISRLRTLRDEGALTAEQYERAVDSVLAGAGTRPETEPPTDR